MMGYEFSKERTDDGVDLRIPPEKTEYIKYWPWSGSSGLCSIVRFRNGQYVKIIASGQGQYADRQRNPEGYHKNDLVQIALYAIGQSGGEMAIYNSIMSCPRTPEMCIEVMIPSRVSEQERVWE